MEIIDESVSEAYEESNLRETTFVDHHLDFSVNIVNSLLKVNKV